MRVTIALGGHSTMPAAFPRIASYEANDSERKPTSCSAKCRQAAPQVSNKDGPLIADTCLSGGSQPQSCQQNRQPPQWLGQAERHLEAQPGHRFRISEAAFKKITMNHNLYIFVSLCDNGNLFVYIVSLCDNGNFIGTTFSIISPLPVGTMPPLPHLQDCSSALGNAVAIFSPTSGSNAKMTRAKSSKGNSSMIHTAQVKQMHGGKVCRFEFSHVSMVVLNDGCFLFHVATGCCSDPNLSCIVIALLGIMYTSPGDSNSYATGLPGNWCVAAHMAHAMPPSHF